MQGLISYLSFKGRSVVFDAAGHIPLHYHWKDIALYRFAQEGASLIRQSSSEEIESVTRVQILDEFAFHIAHML